MESSQKEVVFADAIARAKMVAAKFNIPPTGDGNPTKRPYDDTPDYQPEAKKIATGDGVSKVSQAAALAAVAASQINAKLGVDSSPLPPPPMMAQPHMQGIQGLADPKEIAKMLGFEVNTNESTTVPDKMVGYLIGKGGEQITAIQQESQCVVQFATETNGTPDRPCVLTGTTASITRAKEVLNRLIQNFKTGGAPMFDENANQLEIKVPGNKVGLIIGKGGETIKGLMESTNTKIVVIQDSNVMTNIDKPVRITGDSYSCQKAHQKIMELISDKDYQMTNPYGTPVSSDPYRTKNREMPILRNMIGLVIGKNGEMIRKIQEESGSKVQFKGEDDGKCESRLLSITGTDETINTAIKMVTNLIDSATKQNAISVGGRDAYGQDWSSNTYNLNVPTDKCGIIIGKGGETIRDINRISGAFVELDKSIGTNPSERIFKVVGNQDQIQHAVRLITEKANLPNPMMGPDGYYMGGYPGPMGGMMGSPGYRGPYGHPSPGMGGPMGMMGGPMQGQMMPGMNMIQSAQQWAYNQSYGQTAQTDPSKQSPSQQVSPQQQQQEHAAAWAAYYAGYYNQAMNPMMGYGAGTATSSSTPTSPSQAASQGSNGQTHDYSAAWADYYRSQGMHQHADAVMQMQQQQQPAAAQTQQSPQQGAQPPQQPPKPPQ